MTSSETLTPIYRWGNNTVERVYSRIHYKMRDYANYRFSSAQSCAINIFFDLVQEFDHLEELHSLTVLILRMFFQYEAELYLRDGQNNLVLVTPAIDPATEKTPDPRPEIWRDGNRYYIPVRGKDSLVVTPAQRIISGQDIMGVLALHYTTSLPSHDLLFLEKYANRVGYCLHNKILADRNARHILFLRKLSHDIGHNIITPNMRLKLLLNHLENQIKELGDMTSAADAALPIETVRGIQGKMAEHIKDIQGTFNNSALFLESLLRQSHFDVGHYVLRRVRLDIREAVVMPQFERYRSHLLERGLCVADQPECPAAPCMVEADFGLISQVLANFFSNAAKYAARLYEGRPGEVRCKVEVTPDAFKDGQAGVKVSVFSSGPPIPKDEARQLFDDNYRAANAQGKSGTGHGLFFVREILAAHEGRSGYEALPGGNNFYFILPKVE